MLPGAGDTPSHAHAHAPPRARLAPTASFHSSPSQLQSSRPRRSRRPSGSGSRPRCPPASKGTAGSPHTLARPPDAKGDAALCAVSSQDLIFLSSGKTSPPTRVPPPPRPPAFTCAQEAPDAGGRPFLPSPKTPASSSRVPGSAGLPRAIVPWGLPVTMAVPLQLQVRAQRKHIPPSAGKHSFPAPSLRGLTSLHTTKGPTRAVLPPHPPHTHTRS